MTTTWTQIAKNPTTWTEATKVAPLEVKYLLIDSDNFLKIDSTHKLIIQSATTGTIWSFSTKN